MASASAAASIEQVRNALVRARPAPGTLFAHPEVLEHLLTLEQQLAQLQALFGGIAEQKAPPSPDAARLLRAVSQPLPSEKPLYTLDDAQAAARRAAELSAKLGWPDKTSAA